MGGLLAAAAAVTAFADPRFADKPLGYLTPGEGGREPNFLYDLSNVDEEMLRYDADAMQDIVTLGEGLTFYNRYGAVDPTYMPTTSEELILPLSDNTKSIAVPTFQINGSNDCSSAVWTRTTAPAARNCRPPRRPTSRRRPASGPWSPRTRATT